MKKLFAMDLLLGTRRDCFLQSSYYIGVHGASYRDAIAESCLKFVEGRFRHHSYISGVIVRYLEPCIQAALQ